jgi:hypothetical protein
VASVLHAPGSTTTTAGTDSTLLFHTGHRGAEPSLGIAPDGTVYVLAMDIPDSSGQWGGSRVLRTKDGSAFSDVSPRDSTGGYAHTSSSDPYLYVDPQTGRVFDDDLQLPCSLLSWGDGGRSWHTQTVGCEATDHETIFAGPAPAGGDKPIGYPNVVYRCSVNGGANAGGSTLTTCSKSLDGGSTFDLTGQPPYVSSPTYGGGYLDVPGLCGGPSGHGYVTRDGTVLLPRGVCDNPWLAISRDEGASWQRVQVSDLGMPRMYDGTPDHEAAVVSDSHGTIYYFWVAEDRQPYLTFSRNGGQKWTTPVRVGLPGLRQAMLPALALGPDDSLALAYMGSTTAPGAPFPDSRQCDPVQHPEVWALTCDVAPKAYQSATWDGYVARVTVSTDGHLAIETATVNDPREPLWRGMCGPIRCGAEFDFIDVQVAPDGRIWSAFIDGCPNAGACGAPGEVVVGRL